MLMTFEEVRVKIPPALLANPLGAAEQSFTFPTKRPFVRATVLQLLNFTTEIAHFWVQDPSSGREPPFATATEIQDIIYATRLLARDASMRETFHNYPGREGFPNGGTVPEAAFARTFQATADIVGQQRPSNLPFAKLMFDDKAAQKMYEYIDDTVKSMLEASRKIDAVDLRLIFGWLAFGHPEVTAWLRGQTLLRAKYYRYRVAARRAGQPPPGPYPHHFQSLSHAANLTARQARRSGVSQQDLRARWA